MKTVEIITLGCRVNQYESCAIAEKLVANGFEINKNENCDYYVVNTCAVTAESERKSRQIVRRCARKGKVVVIGCASQLNLSNFDIENVIFIGGNRNKINAADAIIADINSDVKLKIRDNSSVDSVEYECMSLNDGAELFSECRAFVKIQDGCNGKCTYCIIPKCRGRVRSRPVEDIISEVKRLVSAGYTEVILTGIEVSAYNNMPLQDLIKCVSEIEGLERIRLGSLSPNIISDKFLSEIASVEKFMPHFHLSLQSCSDKILKAMKRPYTKVDVIKKVELIRKYLPGAQLSADIIVGFPGETYNDFIETVETVKDLKLFHVHSFPYSEREGTPAATMPESVDKKLRTERNNYLISVCNDNKKQILDGFVGKSISILVEKIIDGRCVGHTAEFFEASFVSNGCNVGDIVKVRVVSHDGNMLYSEVYNGA